MQNKWNKLSNNTTLEFKTFYISYNWIQNETALVRIKGRDRELFCLSGDYRKEFEELCKDGYMACKKFYTKRSKKIDIKKLNEEQKIILT